MSVLSQLLLLFSLVCTAVLPSTALAAEFRIGQTVASAGTAASVPVYCDSASGAVAAQFDCSFEPSLVALTSVSAGSALAGHVVDQEELAPGRCRALVYSPTDSRFGGGPILWLSFHVSPNAQDGVVPIALSGAIMARQGGRRVQPLDQVSGAVTVSSPRDVLSLGSTSDGQLQATIIGVPGRVVTLEGTPDLFHWVKLGTYTNVTGELSQPLGAQPGQDVYFYRTTFRSPSGPSAVVESSLGNPQFLSDGRGRFDLRSAPGSRWRIEGSPDLRHWGDYGVVVSPSGTLAITNLPFGNPPAYYYRSAQP